MSEAAGSCQQKSLSTSWSLPAYSACYLTDSNNKAACLLQNFVTSASFLHVNLQTTNTWPRKNVNLIINKIMQIGTRLNNYVSIQFCTCWVDGWLLKPGFCNSSFSLWLLQDLLFLLSQCLFNIKLQASHTHPQNNQWSFLDPLGLRK